jgi:cyclic-di-GMP-binding biofilm dispersal mediator protein
VAAVTTQLQGSSVLVVGATGGLGAPITRLLADRGACLTLVARDPGRLDALGVRGARTAALDLRSPQAPAAAVAAAVEAHGRLDGIVFAAGVVAFGPAADLDDATLAELFDVNLFAPVRLLAAAYPHLHAGAVAGRSTFVVNISGVVAEQPAAGMAAYTAAKAALAAFDAAAGRELRRARVRLVDARPPHTETGLAGRPIAGQAPVLPPGRRPEDVAARIVAGIEQDERDLPSQAFG